MRKFLLILGTFALMVICGVGALLGTLSYFMNLGMKHYNNYEHYGQTPAVALIFAAGAMGFFAPLVVAWYLYNNPVREFPGRFSLRTLLIIMTLVAILVGMLAAIWRTSI